MPSRTASSPSRRVLRAQGLLGPNDGTTTTGILPPRAGRASATWDSARRSCNSKGARSGRTGGLETVGHAACPELDLFLRHGRTAWLVRWRRALLPPAQALHAPPNDRKDCSHAQHDASGVDEHDPPSLDENVEAETDWISDGHGPCALCGDHTRGARWKQDARGRGASPLSASRSTPQHRCLPSAVWRGRIGNLASR